MGFNWPSRAENHAEGANTLGPRGVTHPWNKYSFWELRLFGKPFQNSRLSLLFHTWSNQMVRTIFTSTFGFGMRLSLSSSFRESAGLGLIGWQSKHFGAQGLHIRRFHG